MRRLMLASLLLAACVEGLECEKKTIPRPPPRPDGEASQATDVQPPGHRRLDDFGFGSGGGAGGGDGGDSQAPD